MQKRMYIQPKLVLIPSWGKLLGYPILGTYRNHKVRNILNDPIIFLSNFECSITNEQGTRHYLFGLGFYYTKFQIDANNYIIDYRRLTCIVLSDFVYQFIKDSAHISAIRDPEVILKEAMFSIVFPIDQGKRNENQLSFIRGVLNREIFIPYKEILTKFIDHLQNVPSNKFKHAGHALLMGTRSDFSMMYLSSSISSEILSEFNPPTPGITHISTNADFILSKEFSPDELDFINHLIQYLEDIFNNISFNPASPLDYFEEGFVYFLKKNMFSTTNIQEKQIKLEKLIDITQISPEIFVTSPKYEKKITWDENHPRKSLELWGIKPKESKIRPLALTELKNVIKEESANIELTDYKSGSNLPSSNYELDIHKRLKVNIKEIPPIPDSSVKKILEFLYSITEEGYETHQLADIFETARDIIKKLTFNSKYIWELSKMTNLFYKEKPGYGLNQMEKKRTLLRIRGWIDEIEEEERLERERLEQERLEKERLERERLEKERLERERLEKERLEQERLERERLEQERLEKERLEQERLERERLERERLERERLEREQLEKERLERERLERERLENEQLERVRIEREQIERELLERERLERKQKERDVIKKEVSKNDLKKKEKLEKERLKREQEFSIKRHKIWNEKLQIYNSISNSHTSGLINKNLNPNNSIKHKYMEMQEKLKQITEELNIIQAKSPKSKQEKLELKAKKKKLKAEIKNIKKTLKKMKKNLNKS
ncbi:hypothetical protein [Candidatus Harpocratesius sp.]